MYEQIIINALETMHEARVAELTTILRAALPAYLDEVKQAKKVSYILRVMKRKNIVEVIGTGHKARWRLVGKNQ